MASYNNNEDAPHEPDGVALVWNMKFKKATPEYIYHCQVNTPKQILYSCVFIFRVMQNIKKMKDLKVSSADHDHTQSFVRYYSWCFYRVLIKWAYSQLLKLNSKVATQHTTYKK